MSYIAIPKWQLVRFQNREIPNKNSVYCEFHNFRINQPEDVYFYLINNIEETNKLFYYFELLKLLFIFRYICKLDKTKIKKCLTNQKTTK